jgi:hypothetical protein
MWPLIYIYPLQSKHIIFSSYIGSHTNKPLKTIPTSYHKSWFGTFNWLESNIMLLSNLNQNNREKKHNPLPHLDLAFLLHHFLKSNLHLPPPLPTLLPMLGLALGNKSSSLPRLSQKDRPLSIVASSLRWLFSSLPHHPPSTRLSTSPPSRTRLLCPLPACHTGPLHRCSPVHPKHSG